jgi:hypothetical protein
VELRRLKEGGRGEVTSARMRRGLGFGRLSREGTAVPPGEKRAPTAAQTILMAERHMAERHILRAQLPAAACDLGS